MNKTQKVIAIVIIISIVGLVGWKLLIARRYDVTLKSMDSQRYFTLKNVAKDEQWRSGRYSVSFHIANDIDLYEDYVKNNEYFIGFIDENNNLVEENADGYLFCQDGYYFYMEDKGNYVIIHELLGTYFPGGGMLGSVHLPVSRDLSCETAEKIPYSELIGVSCYEDLIDFYSRVDSNRYEIDEENGCIYLSVYHTETLIKRAVKLTVLEDGIEVELMEEYRGKSVE